MSEPHTGLLLYPKEPDHWELGGGLASQRFGGGDLNPSGDWTPWKAQDEAQSELGFDTQGCAVFATLKAWVVLAKFYGFDDFPKDLAERYTGVFAGTTRTGTDPHVVAEVTRTLCGAVPQAVMPWYQTDSFEAYYDKKMAESLLALGKELLDRFEFGHEWVFAWGSNYTPAEKADRLRAALKRGPVDVSVDGNYHYDSKGRLTKSVGYPDSHWVNLLKDGTFHDQYDPFIKQLAPNYDHIAAKVYFLKRKEQTSKTFWDIVWDSFAKLFRK
jgi:hypothetical protein